MKRRRFLQIAAAAALTPRGAVAETRSRIALGAETRITLYGPREMTGPALAEVEALLDHVEALFSLYRPTSALSQLNQSGALDAPSPTFLDLLQLSRRLHDQTAGRFDPTIQPLWRALAEGRDPSAARRLIGFDRVQIGADRITLGPGQQLTLNGIAQGYATDLVTAALARHGLTRALVNIGEHRGLGGPWRVGLSDPAHGALGQITLTDRAVATSSPGALHLSGSEAHILNPLGGSAAQWSTVSVTADRAALADGLSTALCFADLAEIRSIAARMEENVTIRLIDHSGDLRTL